MGWFKSVNRMLAAGAIVGSLASISSHWPSRLAAAPEVRVRFEPAPCPFTPASDQVEGHTMECGVVVVPEDRTVPQEASSDFRSPSSRPPARQRARH